MTAFHLLLQSDGDAAGAIVMLIIILLIGLVALIFYFLPSIVAGFRGHHNTAAIFILNLLLGWSFIGWVVSLVWAFTETGENRR